MKHYLDIAQLSRQEFLNLIDQANLYKLKTQSDQLSDYPVALLFYENSTRTRISFEMAANHLAMPVIHVDIARSSENKGERIEDTIENLAAMGITHFVVRHREDGIPIKLAGQMSAQPIHIINAGDGKRAHPSQTLLDMMTITSHKPDLSQCKIAIVGNLRHSRVANSFMTASQLLGVGNLTLVSPEKWKPESLTFGEWTDQLRPGLTDADVIIGLRVQTERFHETDVIDLAAYQQAYRIDTTVLSLAKPDAIVMHPGPVNRGVEMTSDVIDGQQSRILEQVSNGVFARMAILKALT